MRVVHGRMAAAYDDDIVVFLIGMRMNTRWAVWRWLPVVRAMIRMLGELNAEPERGLLGYRAFRSRRETVMVQYWRSAEHLHAFAHDARGLHRRIWLDFYRRAVADARVGIWHETYVVPAGGSEAVYVNMPVVGLRQICGADGAHSTRSAYTPA